MASNYSPRGPEVRLTVQITGKSLGSGSYGSVLEVKHSGSLCAAKKIHEIFLDSQNDGVNRLLENYEKECLLMESLRHPNITQFLGLGYIEKSQLPLLVMEKLEMSVANLVDDVPSLPLSNKISILRDTCNGLVYLHQISNPIVHRDLTANNVLLTSSLTAKISDLGNSLIIDKSPASLAESVSRCPGTLVYMPPEALNGSHYGPPLDVFSFGHLSLYILLQISEANYKSSKEEAEADRECLTLEIRALESQINSLRAENTRLNDTNELLSEGKNKLEEEMVQMGAHLVDLLTKENKRLEEETIHMGSELVEVLTKENEMLEKERAKTQRLLENENQLCSEGILQEKAVGEPKEKVDVLKSPGYLEFQPRIILLCKLWFVNLGFFFVMPIIIACLYFVITTYI